MYSVYIVYTLCPIDNIPPSMMIKFTIKVGGRTTLRNYHHPERLYSSPSVPAAGIGAVDDGGHGDMGNGRRYHNDPLQPGHGQIHGP